MSQDRLIELLGKPLDDCSARDTPILLASLFDRLAKICDAGIATPEIGAGLAEEMRKAAAVMRAWAKFGQWPQEDKRRLDWLERHATLTCVTEDPPLYTIDLPPLYTQDRNERRIDVRAAIERAQAGPR